MTLIEFFDENRIENVACALICKAERVYLLGGSPAGLAEYCRRYGELTGKEFIARSINRSKLTETVKELEKLIHEILAEDEECVLELAGGDDLCLVAAGMVADRFESGVRLCRTNVPHSRIDTFYPESKSCSVPLRLSIAENVRIYGGGLHLTENWDLEAIRPTAELLWSLGEEFPDWNSRCELMGRIRANFPVDASNNPLTVEGDKAGCLRFGGRFADICNPNHLARLTRAQLQQVIELLQAIWRRQGEENQVLRSLLVDEQAGLLYAEFASESAKRLLDKAGQVLEVWLACQLKELKEPKAKVGGPFFQDICVGAELDWDGVAEPDNLPDVNNEIDVMAMRGMIPIFISCKNGKVKTEELYKLSHVAERFGGEYAKKLLVARSLGAEDNAEISFEKRAKEMGIHLIELDELENTQQLLWEIQKHCM